MHGQTTAKTGAQRPKVWPAEPYLVPAFRLNASAPHRILLLVVCQRLQLPDRYGRPLQATVLSRDSLLSLIAEAPASQIRILFSAPALSRPGYAGVDLWHEGLICGEYHRASSRYWGQENRLPISGHERGWQLH